jgi:penicillin amidase
MVRRPWFVMLAVLAVLLLAAILSFAFLRARVASSRLPERARTTESVVGCPGVVDVILDDRGVPHVFSGSDSGLWFAQGYLHARDRFFQMDLARRSANGRVAELFGEAGLVGDRRSRSLRLAASARRQAALLTAEERRVLDLYAAGVNAAIDRFGSWIAPEVWLLGVPPERWSVEDSLAVALMLQMDMSWAMGEELQRAVQLARLGRERAVDLWGWSPQEARAWIPPVDGITHPFRDHEPITAPMDDAGSNSCVVSPERSASGLPLLASGPHFAVQMPGIVYAVQLSGPRHSVSGASIAGIPGVIIGHTEGVAWGLASAMMDDQDLFRLTVDELGGRELVDGQWQPLRTVTENIVVRWQTDPVLLKVRISVHGPVVREQRGEVLALAWTGYQGPSLVRAILGMNRAVTVDGVAAAWTALTGPSMSLIAADTSGEILHQVVGRAPIRGRGAGRLPAPGFDTSWAWKGFRPMAANPRRVGAPEGFEIAANHDLFGEGVFPSEQAFAGEFAPPWRARRIRQVLASRSDWTVDGLLELQTDLTSVQAISLLRQLRADLEARGGSAARELMAWDGSLDADSTAAGFYARFVVELQQAVGGDETAARGLPSNPVGHDEVLRLLVGGLDERWWDDVNREGRQTRGEIIGEVLAELDHDASHRPWGELHTVRFEHPVASLALVGRLLSRTWSRGPFPVGGDSSTVSAHFWSRDQTFTVTAAPAMRFVTEVGNWDATVLGLPVGQSGRPWSGHYADQLPSWLRGEAVPMPFSREAVDHAAKAVLRLVPGRADPRVERLGQ